MPPCQAAQLHRVGVVVPAHDEEATLASCLESLLSAAALIAERVAIVVVLDACIDRSAAVTAEFADRGVVGLVVDHRSVGAARAAGMDELLRSLGTRGTWLATTDADTRVPENWLSTQLRIARSGARVVAGTVAVDDWTERSEYVREQAQRDYVTATDRHVHGANLGFAAEAYVAAGGFRHVSCHEDVEFVATCRARGEAVVWATDLPVITSARRNGRAPNGFSAYLTALERRASVQDDPCRRRGDQVELRPVHCRVPRIRTSVMVAGSDQDALTH
jgi:glycosyltransferase involved in cell wall biosynthesis